MFSESDCIASYDDTLWSAMEAEFVRYQRQVLVNARAMDLRHTR